LNNGLVARNISLLPDWRDLKLWEHQADAIETIVRYLSHPQEGAALIRMPMGTGKTGVMAVLAQYSVGHNILIVVPFAQLRDQTCSEISKEFWQKLSAPTFSKKQVIPFTPSKLPTEEQYRTGSSVLVCTYQTLEAVMRTNPQGFMTLKTQVDLILTDEGHREPAPSWSTAIRRLSKPTILFTATPYRNDFLEFRIDSNFIFRLPYQKAEDELYIRSVSFIEVSIAKSAAAFVDSLLEYYAEVFLPAKPSEIENPRVIVRCETDAEIRQIASLIRATGHSALEIHDNFNNADEDGRFKTVPKPGSTNATFWVHQNKLIEGVDDPSFCLLAIYGGFRSTRALVQQIGRVIRNPMRMQSQIAHVFSMAADQQGRRWRTFLEYERQLGDRSIEPTPGELSAQVLEFTRANLIYLDGGFRAPFDYANPEFYKDLAFTRSALVYRIEPGFSFKALTDATKTTARLDGLQIMAEAAPDGDAFVIVHYRISASPHVRDRIAFDVQFGYTIVHQSCGLLFLSSTEGLNPEYIAQTASMVEPTELERIFSSGDTRIAQVSLMNSDLGAYSVRRRTISSGSLSELAPGLADYSQFCSTAEGTIRKESGESQRNYVGFTRSRVALRSGMRVDFHGYLSWASEVSSVLLDENLALERYFDRFAEPVRAPKSVEPVNILLDVEDLDQNFEILSEAGSSSFTWEDRCSDINNGVFWIVIGNSRLSASINYDPFGERFNITSSDLQKIVQVGTARSPRTLVSQINAEQAFRIVTKEGLVYAHERFYKPRLPLWGRNRSSRIDVTRVLHSRQALTDTTSEKGGKGSANGEHWGSNSVFSFIDAVGRTGLLASERFRADILVCDDLGNELADFIALQRNPLRIAFIHAKQVKSASDGTNSASAFHEVCSQAVKNLGPLTPQWEEELKNTSIWNKSWTGTHGEGSVRKRIRKTQDQMAASAIWTEIQRTVRDPAASREVWLVMGGGLSLSKFESERNAKNPPGHLIQLVYLLQGTWSTVSSIGATLKVFCAP